MTTEAKQMTAERPKLAPKPEYYETKQDLYMDAEYVIAHLEQRIAEKQQAYSSMAEVAIRHENECDKLKAEHNRMKLLRFCILLMCSILTGCTHTDIRENELANERLRYPMADTVPVFVIPFP